MLPIAAATLAVISTGFKAIKYFVDSTFRDKVLPVQGSVVYCDLWVAVEHSGIYMEDRQICNIEVDGFAESTVRHSGPESFTAKSTLGRKIYVSCNSNGAVGHPAVARRAERHVGERGFYGLVIKNCHQFSTKCVNQVGEAEPDPSLLDRSLAMLSMDTWEPTMAALKHAAREKLGATKWRLWDWQNNANGSESVAEPDWKAQEDACCNLPLNPESIAQLRQELKTLQDYESEIADENIPEHIRKKLLSLRQTLEAISSKYDEVKHFLSASPGADFSYADLQACGDDFSALAAQMQSNPEIKDLARKMGRNYISEEKKIQTRVPQASKSEVHGTHRSDDLMRVLPSELLNLEDETLETLFYARLLEKNLLSYELKGITYVDGDEAETIRKRTGPVIACLDTSGSMSGTPTLKAKALLLAVANILKQEDRSLHVLLFGSTGQIAEFSMDDESNSAGLLRFLKQGFDGGTDFETPLKRAIKIIAEQENYLKADILMITDGACSLSAEYAATLVTQKSRLDFAIYTVLCAGGRIEDAFSDEVVVL